MVGLKKKKWFEDVMDTLSHHFAQYIDTFPLGQDRSMREAAMAVVQQHGLPVGEEAWKYVDFTPLQQQSYGLSYGVTDPELPSVTPLSDRYIHVMDGRIVTVENCEDLGFVQLQQPTVPNPLDGSDSVLALNRAFMQSGIQLVVPPQATTPVLHVLYDGLCHHAMTNQRHEITVQSGANFVLVEHFVNQSQQALSNQVLVCRVETGAMLQHYRLFQHHSTHALLTTLHIDQQENSDYQGYGMVLPSGWCRHQLSTTLRQDASFHYDGLSLLRDEQRLDQQMLIHHEQPVTKARVEHRGIVNDRASSTFRGNIRVSHGADKTDSGLQDHNLLLSKQAMVNSLPQLEIYADDVRCQHGSTSGSLDEAGLFYLASRGIPTLEAQRMLLDGFAGACLEKITLAGVRQLVEAEKARYLTS